MTKDAAKKPKKQPGNYKQHLKQLIPVLATSLLVLGLVIIGVTTNSGEDTSSLGDEEFIEDLREQGLALYNDPHSGIQLIYSEDLAIAINKEPVEGVTFNMTKEDPRIQITSWFEEGESISDLRITNRNVAEAIIENSKPQLARTYKNIEIQSERSFRINGFEASEMVFSYSANDGTTAIQRFLVVLKNNNTAVTVAFQTDQPDYDSVNDKYFDQIAESITF